MKTLTTTQEDYIRNNYLKIPVKQIAQELGFSKSLVNHRLKIWNLVIPVSIRQQRKRKGCFSKGHKPFNKGKKAKDYLDTETQRKIALTQFKKGNKPVNTKTSTRLSLRTDSAGIKYWYYKIRDSHWVLYHRHIWTESFGEIPQNKIIAFKDGNTNNVVLDNLELISRSENLKRNQDKYHLYPSHIKPILSLTYKLTHQIKQHESK